MTVGFIAGCGLEDGGVGGITVFFELSFGCFAIVKISFSVRVRTFKYMSLYIKVREKA